MPYTGTLIKAKEETLARTVETGGERDNKNSPAYKSSSYRKQLPDVERVRKVYGGTKTMRDAGKEFLKPHPMESKAKWEDRKDVAVAFNGVKQTVGGMNGMIFRNKPTFSEDMPDELAGTETTDGDLDNIDMQGRAFHVFWRDVADNALIDGHTWVHVESPRRDERTIGTRRAERDAEFRPYWINLTKQQVINWRYAMRSGRPVLTLVAYTESALVPDGDFGERTVNRIRLLREAMVAETEAESPARRIVGELWEFREKGADDAGQPDDKAVDRWVRVEFYALDTRITEVPVVCVYAGRDDVFVSTPPLDDLAYEQIEHYRVRSERQKKLSFASVAVPYHFSQDVVDEEGNVQVRWGDDGMLLSNDPEAQAGIIESRGFGLEAMRDELRDIEGRMARQGLQLLVRSDGTQPRTATAEIFEKSESDAWLALFAKNLEDSANECLGIHGTYRGLKEVGQISLNDDFHDQLIDAQTLRELNAMVVAGNLSLETLWEVLKRGGTLPEEHSADEERGRIAADAGVRLDAAERELFGRESGGGNETEPTEEAEPAA